MNRGFACHKHITDGRDRYITVSISIPSLLACVWIIGTLVKLSRRVVDAYQMKEGPQQSEPNHRLGDLARRDCLIGIPPAFVENHDCLQSEGYGS